MCGRYTLRQPARAFETALKRTPAQLPGPRFNISPGERLPIILPQGEGRTIEEAFWGLTPSWRVGKGPPMANLRAETILQKPSFQTLFRRKRCVIPADGFYEWKTVEREKRPHFFRFRGDAPFAFAGLWEEVTSEKGPLLSFSLITTEPNAAVQPIHDRMPVILNADRITLWLEVAEEEAEKVLPPLLWPFPADDMEAIPVNPWVNKTGNEGPRCLDPWEGEDREQLTLF